MKNKIWVIEVDFEDGNGWVPSVWAYITKRDAQKNNGECRAATGARTRIKKYGAIK